MLKFTKEKIEGLKNTLGNLPPIEDTKEFSMLETIKILQPEISKLQKRGYSLEKIVEVLQNEGVLIHTPTLKNYLQRSKRPSKKTKSKNTENQK